MVVVPLLLGAACAYYPKEDGERLNNEVYALQTQVNAVQEALTQLRDAEKVQTKKLSAMTEEMAALSKVARRNDADLGVQLEEMLQETARMKGRVETFSERVTDLEAAIGKVQGELDVRFQGLAEQRKIEQAQSEEEKKRAIEEAKLREQLIGKPSELFTVAEKMIGGGKAKQAQGLLRELVIRLDGDRKQKKNLGEAQYWIAESYLAEANFQQAAAEFNKVRKTYPRHNRVPEALFKLGVCFENLKLTEDAKLFYTTVIKKHRKSSAATMARKRLKKLK